MTVLVTRGTGYPGGAIVRALAARGREPIVLARRASSSGLPGRSVDADVRDREALAAARGVDAIIHAAALVSLWRPRREEFDAVNVAGLRNALDVCRTPGIPRFV